MAVPSAGFVEVQNNIKEIDMQIVYRRLEARKNNITKDGKMSKKQLASAYRGYHGMEAQYHAMVRMSDESMMNVKARNDHINLKHNEDMKSLDEHRRTVSRLSRKEIESISEEFKAQLAYQYVYKNHSFKRFDNTKATKKSRPTSDKPEMYLQKQQTSLQRSNSFIRPLGSLRQMETYNDELKLPKLNDTETEKRTKGKSKINMMGEKRYEDMKVEKEKSIVETKSFPKIEGALGVEIKYKYKSKDDDKESLLSAPAGFVDDEAVVYNTGEPPLVKFDMGRNLMLMRKAEQENYNRQRVLPVPPSADEAKKHAWRRVLPVTPSRPSSVYPRQETNPIGYKKTLQKEVTDLLDTWGQANVTKRLEIVEKVKQIEKERNKDNPPPTFDTSRPTSAIIRDFKEYKKTQAERRYAEENNQPITVKQMTVEARPASPSVTRRNEYSSRVQTPGKLRRTFSEKSDKFSSVSRTISYGEIPDDFGEIAANALLTAAERIEKEKVKRNSAKQRPEDRTDEKMGQGVEAEGKHSSTNTNNENTIRDSNEKPRRQLPTTPKQPDVEPKNPSQKKPGRKYNPSEVYVQQTVKSKRLLQQRKTDKMFDTTILARTSRDDSNKIEEVRKANRNESTPLPLKKLRPGTPQSYTDDGESTNSTSLYMFSAKPTPQNIKQKMKFDYDNFSRTTPNMKKKLEVRAKNRRKIQHQNKLLNDEKRYSPIKDSDRASTIVSFNESVMVFQTI